MSSPSDPGQKLDLLSRELAEARDQQAAITDILRVISNSPGDVKPVFECMARHAARICEAPFADIIVVEAGMLQLAASVGGLGPYDTGWAIALDRTTFMGRSICDKQTLHIADAQSPDLDFPLGRQLAIKAGARTALAVPLIRDDRALGTILVRRTEVRLFEEKHIALLKTFADQAAIAIENARLLNELRQRTDDLSESLEQQTATSEVLRVIASSSGELQPVFEAILANATRLCGAKFGNLNLYDGNEFRAVTQHNVPPAYAEARPRRFRPHSASGHAEIVRTKQSVHIQDVRAMSPYREGDPALVTLADLGGARTVLIVPMLKENALIGTISIYRQEVRAFTDKQIELVENFSAQAVIAIENARLLNELRQRTDDLSESLEQQTATSEVLRIIASSPADTQPVFDAIVQSGLKLFPGALVSVALRYGDRINAAAIAAPDAARVEAWRRTINSRTPLARDYMHGAALLDRRIVDIPDVADAPAEFAAGAQNFLTSGNRAITIMPMMRGDEAIGLLSVVRLVSGPLSDKQIAVLKTFAAQAVIAIENARLLSEVRQQASQLEAQSQELRTLNQGLEQRVDEQVGEIERMGRLRRFLPPQVADLIVSSGAEKLLESHRREITALFCDLRGFTGFSETSDPEDVMALLREYHKAIGEIIFRHGGTLERFAGDGVMVIFNDPVPLPNPALSAVQMALEMRAAIGALIDKWSRLGHELGFGIGISHGYATLGTIGFEGRFDYAAIGTVSNVASRLCDEAQPGQILVSPRVLLAVEGAVSVEPVREMSLKGIRRPMLVHNVVGATAGNPGSG
jgi:class 3 adenylate cyclase